MENNSLVVEKYNKIYALEAIEDPRMFSHISLLKKVSDNEGVAEFEGQNKWGQAIRVYFGNQKARKYDTNIIYISSSPNIILIEGSVEDLIIEAGAEVHLDSFLHSKQLSSSMPYLDELEARRIIMQLNQSASNFASRSLVYDCLTPENVVYNSLHQKWELSLAAYLFQIKQDDPKYNHPLPTNQTRMAFSMACLLFKLIYGFSPLPDTPHLFDGTLNYIASIKMSNDKLLKTYYFCERDPLISHECKDLLDAALKGNLTWDSWLDSRFFKPQFEDEFPDKYQSRRVSHKNQFLRMTMRADPGNYSLIMAAITYKESHPSKLVNNQPQRQSSKLSSEQNQNYIRNHISYKHINLSKLQHPVDVSQLDENQIKIRKEQEREYFPGQYFQEDSFPCRELIRLMENQKKKYPEFDNDDQYDRLFKLHGFPYALGYELLKVSKKQPMHIQTKISQAFDLLMRVASFNRSSKVPTLTSISPNFTNFEEIKPTFRASLNELYQHFLNEAMRKYNSKTDKHSEEIVRIRKTEGLDYYRLCLKLLECSLLMRKKGTNLFLERIETNSRKEIQSDISALLSTYFPQKPQIH